MRPLRPWVDRGLDALAWLVMRGLYRTVEVVGAERIPRDRPVVVVANHFNGLVDAVLLALIIRGVPRFVAKATLWRSPLLRPFLALAGLVPVQRPEDRQGVAGNTAAFGRAHDILRRNGTLAIFPEGTTHDRLELARVRTGAARIALGARAEGVTRIAIVPIGLVFDDKLALRSRVLARVGEPIDLDAAMSAARSGAMSGSSEGDGAAKDTDRSSVRRLTSAIEDRLGQLTPAYGDAVERAIFSRAADVRLRRGLHDPSGIVSMVDRESLAQGIAHASPEARDCVVAALGRYQLELDVVRLRDEQLVPHVSRRWLLERALRLTAFLVLLGVVMLAGMVVNLLPTLVTASAGNRTAAPAMKGTVRVLTALVVFPLTWIGVAVAVPVTGFMPTALVVAACPVTGAVAVAGLERAVRLGRAWTGWLGLRNATGLLGRIFDARAHVCDKVDAASRIVSPGRSPESATS